jgi:PAS domain S-box-containing protein
MKKKAEPSVPTLRPRAELQLKPKPVPGDLQQLSAEEMLNLVHEMEVYQTGLETQIDELLQAQATSDEAAGKYSESERNYRDLIENLTDVIYRVDPDGIITFISPSIEKIIGFTSKEIIGKNFNAFVGGNGDLMSERLQNLSLQPEMDNEYKLFSRSGEPRWVRLSTRALFYDGSLCGAYGTLIDFTARKIAELELQNSESLYRSVLNASPDVITITDLEGRILLTSPRTLEMFGYTQADILNHTLLDFIDPRDHGRAQAAIFQMFQDNFTGVAEYTGIKSDGSLFEIEVNGEFIRDGEGKPSSMVFITRDISDRKIAEQKLKKSEDLFRNIVESINDVVFEISIDGTISYVSPSIWRIFGLMPIDMVGQNFFRYVHPDDLPFLIDIFKRNLFDEFKRIEYRCITDDGEVRWVQVSARSIIENGTLTGRAGILHDITDQKIADGKLRKSEEQYRKLVETINDVIFEIDNEGTIKYISPVIEKIIGYKPVELIGKNVADFMHPDDRPGMKALFVHNAGQNVPYLEYRFIHKTGEFCWVQASSSILTEHGETGGHTGILTEITARKISEENIEKLNRLYQVVSHVNQSIVHLRDRDQLLDEVCRIAIEFGKFHMAWIGLLDEDTKKVSPRYVNGKDEGYLARVNQISIDDVPEGRGPSGTAVREGVHFISDDIETDPRMALWRDEALKRGYRSSIALPFKQFGKVRGVFNLYASVPHFFNLEETKLLVGITEEIGFALEALETEKERKEAEDRLRKLSRAVEQSPVSIVITDLEGNIEYANPKACETTGYTLDELIGQNPRVLKSGETQAIEYGILWENISTGSEWRGVFHNKRKNGELYWESSTISPITNADGKITHYLAVKEDITNRKKTEEALFESEERFRQVVEQTQEVVWEVDATGLFAYVSPMAMQMYGYTPEEMVGKLYFYDLLPEKGREQSKKEALEVFQRKEKIDNFINQIERPDGKDLIIATSGIPILDAEGNLTGYRGINANITKQVRAEEELRKFRTISDQANYGNAIASLDGTLVYVNQAMARMHGWEPEELTGENLTVLHNDEQMPQVTQLLGIIESEGGFSAQEVDHVRKNGSVFASLMSAALICDADNVPQYLSATIIDITELKQSEAALKHSEETLNYAQEIGRMGSWELNFKTRELTGSNYYYNLLGLNPCTKKHNLFDYFLDIVHPDDMHVVDYLQQDNYRNNETKIADLRIVLPGGEIKWLQNNVVPVYADGALVALKGVNIDITDKKLAEEQIHLQNERMQAIISTLPDMLFVIDKDGVYKEAYCSDPDVFFIPPDQIIGTSLRNMFDEESANWHHQKIKDCIQQKKIITYEYALDHNEVPEYFESRLAPLGDDRVLALIRDITEKRQKDIEIRKLSLAVEQSPVSIEITDLDGNIQYINQAFLAASGYRREELIGKNSRLLKSGNTIETVYQNLWQSISGGKQWFGELMNRKKNGEFYWENISITPIRDAKGEITNYLAVKQDSTERKRTEDILKQSEERYRYMFVNNPQPMWIYDLQTLNFLEVNSAAINHYGYSRDEFLSMSLTDIRPADDIKALLEDVKQPITKLNSAGEWHHIKKNGEIIVVEIISHSITYNDRDARHILVNDITKRKQTELEIQNLNQNLENRIEERTTKLAETNQELIREIDERKRTQEALAESEKGYRTVVENVNEVIFQTDAQGQLVFLNKSWEDITGFSVEEAMGQVLVNYVYPDDRQRNSDLFGPMMRREIEYCRYEVRFLTRKGGFRWIEVFARLGVSDTDAITGTFGTLQDITERKLAENFENELLQLSPFLTGLPLSKIGNAITLALSRIGQFLVADRAYVFEFDVSANTMSNTHEWCNEGINPEIENLQKIPFKAMPQWMEALRRHENIVIGALDQLPESWQAEREHLQPQGIQSMIAIPLLAEDTLIGIVGLDSVVAKKEYKASEINILKVWSSMLASLINNQRTGKKLEQTRQNFETFFNTIDDFLFIIDQQGNIIHTNDTVNNRLGFTNEELINQSILAVHPPERREEAGRIVGEMLAGTTEYCPVPIVTKSGKQIPVETRVKPGFWDDKPVIFGVTKDVSKIRLSEEKFSRAFQSNSALMVILGYTDHVFIDSNDAFLKTLGYSSDEIIGKSLADYDFYADTVVRDDIFEKLKTKSPVREIEIRICTKSGTIIVCLFSADYLTIGNELCVLAVMVNITERKLAEDALRESENRFSQFMDYLPAVVFLKDNEGRTLFVNKYMDEAFGASQWMGKNMLDVFPGEFGEKLLADDISSLKSGYQKIEESLIQLDGKLHYFETQKFAIHLSLQDAILGGISIDITERKQSEAEISKARNEAEQANLAKSEFLSRMSHELRTPMNSILGFAQLMEMGELEPAQRKGVNHILNSGKHLLDLINEVLDISRIEAGHISLLMEPVPLGGVILEMIDIVRHQARQHQQILELIESPVNRLFVRADSQRLKQVLLNLINNAVKYNREGGSVVIKTRLLEKENPNHTWARVSISDTGIGISAGDIQKLFLPFERIGAEKSEIEGTGLGLTVVKKLMDAMGGNIGVESVQGVGSTFWIELPLTESQLESVAKATGQQKAESVPIQATAKVLYIEDNVSNVELIEQILSSQRPGIQLIANKNGRQAVHLATDCRPDLILLDLDLPDLHGSEVIKLLMSDDKTKRIPVVIVSADAMPKQLQKLLKTGARDYLTKPLDVATFLKVIDEYVAH